MILFILIIRKFDLDMILFILIMGCVFFLFLGIIITSLALFKLQEDGTNIERMTMFLAGFGVMLFGFFCVYKVSIYCREKENPKTEITTSISPQIDTIITIRNSVPDTSYIYKFNLTEE